MMIAILILAVLILIGIVLILLKPSNTTAFDHLEKSLERTERLLREEIAANRGEQLKGLQGFSASLTAQLNALSVTVERQLKNIQDDNAVKLEKMRETVDEKLQSTLEKRLGDSFKMVSDRLEKVHQGLGEMQTLAVGVGDLKKVLSNVKTRGAWGEAQLGNLLEQILSPDQYERNVVIKAGTHDQVEFAVRMPGQGNGMVLMPIDAKFPTEDYERLLTAVDAGDAVAYEAAAKALEARIKLEARNIRDKYLQPPETTDFAILFLPIEGLYAEVLRRPGLADILRRDFNVIVTGPTTIVALLNCLQIGFRTMAVQKRASEVWSLLGSVKNEFGKFGDLLEKAQKKLESASEEIGNAARKSRTIEKELKDVQVIAPIEPVKVIDIP